MGVDQVSRHDHSSDSEGGSEINPESVSTEEVSITDLGGSAHLTDSQSISDNSFTKVDFDDTRYDDLDEFDLSNNKFVVERGGRYFTIAQIRFGDVPDGTKVIAQIKVNGTGEFRADSHASTEDYVAARVSGMIDLSAGDEIEMYAYQNSGSNQTAQSGKEETYLQVTKLG